MTMIHTGNPMPVEIDFDSPPDNPLDLLQQWLEAADRLNVSGHCGMVLSTVDTTARPASRVVLLTGCDKKGIIFGTSEGSTKGAHMAANPWVAGTLWWRETVQQVNLRGCVKQLPDEISDTLFQTRVRAGQAVSVISKQSAPLLNEAELKDKVHALIDTSGEIKRPAGWHAYHIMVDAIEFWCGNEKSRLHKRLRYNLVNNAWHYQRLQP